MNQYFLNLLMLILTMGFIFSPQIAAVSYTYASDAAPNGYPDTNNLELTDGYFPQPYGTDVVPWVGAGPAKHLKPIFNFGQAITLDSLRVFAHSGSAGIGMPAGMAVSFSNDGLSFGNTQFYTTPSSYITNNVFPTGYTGNLEFTLSGAFSSRTAQYIMVDVYNSSSYWIFLGEITFSTSVVPEASSIVLSALGSLVLLGMRLFRK